MDYHHQNHLDNNSQFVSPREDPIKRNAKQSLSIASLILGILSIVSLCLICIVTFFPCLIFGGIGSTLALLSRGKDEKLCGVSLPGFILSLIGSCLGILATVGILIILFTSSSFFELYNNNSSYEDFFDDYYNYFYNDNNYDTEDYYYDDDPENFWEQAVPYELNDL